mmetsp:Transcript_24281/g.41469  ORF Transcript_24281/g.41469 Transcript_24281/m.41469 type:complete len:167 (-) Transcript_24281:46-546(-)
MEVGDEVSFSNKDLKNKSYWACLSNYFVRDTFIQGYSYPTVEHYFQAQKFSSKEYKDEIRAARSGLQAKKLGSVERDDIVENWDEIKDDIMRRGVAAKFHQHQDLQAVLMATKQAEIIFKSSTDSYWGKGKNGGENKLGEVLVSVREELRLGQIRLAMQCHGVNFN